MDRFLEESVSKHHRAAEEVLYYASWVVMIVSAILAFMYLNVMFYSFSISMLVMTLVFTGIAVYIFFFHDRLRTEYDYSFTNGVLDVARVLNGRKRVYLTSFDVRDLRAAGEESSSAFQSCARQSGAQLHRWYLNKEAKKYFFFYDKKGGRHLTILELNDEMARAIFNRRFLTAEVWDGAYKSV